MIKKEPPNEKIKAMEEAIKAEEASVIFDEDKNPERKEKKRKSASNKYYQLPEEELQEVLTRAKEGDTKAQQQLIKIFDNFLSKYVALLFKGKYDLHDYDIRRFVGLFVTNADTRLRLRYNKITFKTYQDVGEVMRGINYMIARYNDIEDVRSTVEMSFLQCVDKYVRKGPIPFSGYIYNYMFYILQKNVEVFLIDQLGRKSFPLYTDDSVSSAFTPEGMEAPQHIDTPTTPSVEDLLGPEMIDENWVVAEGTAVWPFDQLTPHQRQLLKWRYVDGLKASKIAQKTTEHPNTCRAQFQEIRAKLEELIRAEKSF